MNYGFLYEGELTGEQTRARQWLEGAGHDVTPIDLASFDRGAIPKAIDALWWHRTHPLTDLSAVSEGPAHEALVKYVETGGGLLLTQQAFEAAYRLGFESQRPDTEAIVVDDGPSGFTARNLYRNHPLFEGLDETFETKERDRDHHDAPLYWRLNTPQDGEIVGYSAGGPQGGEMTERELERSLVTWYPEGGAVVGIARNTLFGSVSDGSTAEANLTTLLSNALGHVADGGADRLPGENRPRGPEEGVALRERLSDNHYRPRYHFAPPAGWSNDPCGLIEWNGEFHLFYQHNPHNDFWGNIHWGHATSEDLLHWADRGIGLNPAEGEPANNGVWTGASFKHDDTAHFFYTAMGWDTHIFGNDDDYRQQPCLATASAGPDENIRELDRIDDNPLFETPPMGFYGYENQPADLEYVFGPSDFRDHHVWAEDGEFYQLVGTGLHTANGNPVGGGVALLYRSTGDLTEWEYVDYVTAQPDSDFLSLPSGRSRPLFWECTQLFQFDTKSLIHWSWGSNGGEVGYHWGTWDLDNHEFNAEQHGRIALGDYYAPQGFEAEDGRTLMFGWVLQTPGIDHDDGWADTMMTIPHELREGEDPADPDGPSTLRIAPVEEMTAARKRSYVDVDLSGTDLSAAETPNYLDTVADQSVELDLTLAPDPGTTTTFSLCQDAEGQGGLTIEFEALDETTGRLRVDRSAYTDRADFPESDGVVLEQDVALQADGTVDLRIFLDRSVVELFANEQEYVVSRLYPPTADHTHHTLTASGGTVTVASLDAYQLGSIWEHFERPDALVSALAGEDGTLTGADVRAARSAMLDDEPVEGTLMKVTKEDIRTLAREVGQK